MALGTEIETDGPKQVSSSSSLDSCAINAQTGGVSQAVSIHTSSDGEQVVAHHDTSSQSTLSTKQSIPSQPLLLPAAQAMPTATTGPATIALNGSVPEFLFQLMKMLTDDNREIIEWSNGRIEVHSPQRLEASVLSRYFRHSKFASFQRQLNYFGFRKLAGKGKMSPCSYVNESVQGDLSNLLLIKVRTNLHRDVSIS